MGIKTPINIPRTMISFQFLLQYFQVNKFIQVYSHITSFYSAQKKIPQPITLFRLTFHTIYPRITSYYLETLRANRVITIKRYCRFVATSFELQFDKATFTLFIDKCESSSFGCTRYFLKLCIRIQMCSGKKKRLFVLR